VPQNFAGGQNPGVAVGATAGAGGIANQNVTGGSSLNLRGLGPDATLTLLNGRRLSYGGLVQAVDISAIPVEAVDRLEIVADGASAIYGSDAVGGVGNVILKRDYEGLTISARYGGATDGGLTTSEYSATGGLRWSGGGVIATYSDASVDPIYARQRDYTDHMSDPTTLYPGSDRRSALISVHQSFGEAVELGLDMLRTERKQASYPWNTGLRTYYNHVTPRTETFVVSPSLAISLPGDWTLTLGGSWGKDEHVQQQSRVVIASGISTTRILECYCNRSQAYEVSAEGPLFQTPAGDVRLAIGTGDRKNKFTQRNYLTDEDVVRGEESSRFAYGELSVPLIGPEQARRGFRRLDVTAAMRAEDYDSFGSVTTPKVGLIYDPNEDLTVKASWGKSFKAPTLFQRNQAQTGSLDPATAYGGSGYDENAAVLGIYGGDPDLGPERATTRTLTLAYHPKAISGLEAELTGFDIDYRDRVVEPITNYSNALQNPDYVQFIAHSPTGQQLAAAIASTSAVYNYLGRPYDPADVVAIAYAQSVNVARQRIKGLDLSASYRFDLGSGRMAVRGSATWLDSEQQNVATQPAYDVAGTLFNPAKVHARMGGVWDRGGFSATSFVNFTDSVTDSVTGRETGSFTTVDLTLRYATSERPGAFSGLEFALSAQNLLDRAPPSYVAASLDAPPYDSTNYSAIGRFVSLSVSKRW
jgi:iron complex outermembrane receptor protein